MSLNCTNMAVDLITAQKCLSLKIHYPCFAENYIIGYFCYCYLCKSDLKKVSLLGSTGMFDINHE